MLAWSGWRDCSGFLYPGAVVVGAVRLKLWGVVWLFFFLDFTVNSPGGWLSVVGFCSSILVFFSVTIGTIRGFVCYELLIFPYLLQVVQAE